MAHVGFEENIAYRVLNRASSMSRVTFQLVQPFPGCNIRLRYVFPLPSKSFLPIRSLDSRVLHTLKDSWFIRSDYRISIIAHLQNFFLNSCF